MQEVLEKALSTLLRETIEVVGAGRTDAGVHAKEMFAHFDVEHISDLEELVYRLNAFLPDDIAAVRIKAGKLLIYDGDRYGLFHDRFRVFLVGEQKDPVAEAIRVN